MEATVTQVSHLGTTREATPAIKWSYKVFLQSVARNCKLEKKVHHNHRARQTISENKKVCCHTSHLVIDIIYRDQIIYKIRVLEKSNAKDSTTTEIAQQQAQPRQ
jgi:hypothetical protein